MESQSQNPEFRINPENFHPCKIHAVVFKSCVFINDMHTHIWVSP